MCGIIGYVGDPDYDTPGESETLDVLVDGLSNLEYRGYDSAGVALANGSVEVVKTEGEVDSLRESLADINSSAPTGIGHTRWSTHGPPADRNAHPHTGDTDRVAVVHNGIIENYDNLRSELTAEGHEFESDTDTEVVPHLIEEGLNKGLDRPAAFQYAVDQLEGSYAIAAVFAGDHTIYATRQDSPLVLGHDDGAAFLASDVPAFIEHTDQVTYLDDGEFARLDPNGVAVTDSTGTPIDKSVRTVDWDPEDAGKSGYDHYMLKEIHEQPRALRNCLRGRVDERSGTVIDEEFPDVDVSGRVHFVACGTSYHAALYGARLFREYGVSAQVFLASEYDARSIPVDDSTVVIGVTQSGETADTLSALRSARRGGATTLAVTNTVGSTAARECDDVLYIRSGPEIGVAATKTFASQQVALTLLGMSVATDTPDRELVAALRDLPDQIQTILDDSDAKPLAETYVDSSAYFFIGRGDNRSVALEGALKMKEITYKHAEGFAAGELKHGPLALVESSTPVFAVVTGDDERAIKTIGNMKEVDARDAPVIAVTDGRADAEEYANDVLEIPETHPRLAPVLANVQLQLVSYHVADLLGRSIDKPRNLAKSVTVE